MDKHVIKQILEYAQLLSTAHRVLDGTETTTKSKTGRNVKRWQLTDEREDVLYSATHINHPSAVWVRKSQSNYIWLYNLWRQLMIEYTYRYGKNHACEKLIDSLCIVPHNIPDGVFTEPTPAMPDEVKIKGSSIASYRNYYLNNKTHLAAWKNRPIPNWFVENNIN